MLDSVTQDAAEYRSTIRKLAESSSSFAALHEFVNVKRHLCQAPAGFTPLTISPEPQDEGPGSGIEFKNILSLTTLSQELGFLNVNERCCRLFFVENMCSESIALLGGVLKVPPEFFARHLHYTNSHRVDEISDRLPRLPSITNSSQFCQIVYMELQRCVEQPFSRSGVGWPDRSLVPAGGEIIPEARLSGARCHVKSDESNSRITRKARKLIPWIREGRNFEALVSARQLVTIWFGVEKKEANTWTGIILLDPPFKARGEDCFVPPEFRPFVPHSELSSLSTLEGKKPSSLSNLSLIIDCLSTRLYESRDAVAAARSDCFFLLGDIYRLAASNWIVINEYVKRELATMGYLLERQDPGFKELETYLKDLYIYNRRFSKYHEIVARAREQCLTRGQRSWPNHSTSASVLAERHARELADDFQCLEKMLDTTSQRVDKSINLLAALVSIEEAKQALDENHGIARLSFLAIVFLPFSTVATVLSMQGTFAPGQQQFWMFWVVALCLTASVIGIFVLYDKVTGHWKNWPAKIDISKVRERRKITHED